MSTLGDRMKSYEQQFTSDKTMPLIPTLVRIDGRSFSSWTRGLEKPYDINMHNIMRATTEELVKEFSGVVVGYTQSDEISLVLLQRGSSSQLAFDGKIFKMNSNIASYATAVFNSLVPEYLPEKVGHLATFDCRTWQVPNEEEACNYLIWREQDARRNSISGAAQSVYSHKELHKKNSKDMLDMLIAKGINWNNYPDFFKRGTYLARTFVDRKYTTEELERLPARHEARSNPDLVVTRSETVELDLGGANALSKIENRVEYIFDDDTPILRS